MDNRSDELHLLGHTLGEFLHLLVPPALYSETDEPLLEFGCSLAGAHALELSEIHGLFSDLHLAVKTALFRQISDLLDILLSDRTAIEEDRALVWNGDPVDDSDKGRLSGTVRTEKNCGI